MKSAVIPSPITLLRRLREKMALKLLRRVHRINQRLPVKLKQVEKSRVLVIAPHMDDDVIGPGGTLALHRQCGSSVYIVFCAAGATPEDDKTRKAESRESRDFMGFEQVEWLDFPDGNLSNHENQISSRIAQLINDFRPQSILCPHPTDHHRDHSAATHSLGAALQQSEWKGDIWCYEVWSPLWPNFAVDISSVVEIKKQAIGLYESQTAGLHYIDGTLGLNRYRGLRVYVDYAEAFLILSEEDFLNFLQPHNVL